MADLSFICKHKVLTKLWDKINEIFRKDLEESTGQKFEEMSKERREGLSWKMLVMDRYALKIISSFCGMDDLLNADVLDVNTLEKPREPLMCPALYIIQPVKESIDMVIKDFSDRANPTYSRGFVVCINAIDKESFDRLTKIDRIGKDCVHVLPLDFIAVEQRVFSLNNPNAFYNLYSPNATEEMREAELERTGNAIAAFLMFLNINPEMRYIQSVSGSLAQRLSKKVHDGFGALSGNPIIDWDNPSDPKTKHWNLIIADRISDVITPLMTEHYLQSMVHDVMDVKKGTVSVMGAEGKPITVFLDDTDDFWRQLRHKHIGDAGKMWVEEYRKFTSAHKELAHIKENAKDMKKVQEAMSALPEYMDLANRFSCHRNIITAVNEANEGLKLETFMTGEQALGSGVDSDGKAIKRPIAYVQSAVGSVQLEADRRLREALIFFLSQEYTDADKSALMNMLKSIDQSQEIVDAALKLPKTVREVMKNKKVVADLKATYELSRYNPLIKELVIRMSHNEVPSWCVLDELKFNGFVTDIKQESGNLTVAAGKTLKKQKGKGEKEGLANAGKVNKLTEDDLLGKDTNILVIFITGAISYSEMRVVYELSEKLKMNIFIGSHYIVNQNRFVKMIRSLNNEKFVDITPEMETSKIAKDK